jgi:hypothetical protein
VSTDRWKRSDVTTNYLLWTILGYGTEAADYTVQRWGVPPKVVLAAILRDAKKGYLTWGVSAWRPYINTQADLPPLEDTLAPPPWWKDTRSGHPCGGIGPGGECTHQIRERINMVDVGELGGGDRRTVVTIRATYIDPATGAGVEVDSGVQGADAEVAAYLRAWADKLDPPKPKGYTYRQGNMELREIS